MSITIETAKLSASLKREASQAWKSLAHFLGSETLNSDAKKASADNAAAAIGRKRITGKLPTEIGAMRGHIETLKQRAAAIVKQHDSKAPTYEAHCDNRSVVKDALACVRFCDMFIAEYNVAKASIAKAA